MPARTKLLSIFLLSVLLVSSLLLSACPSPTQTTSGGTLNLYGEDPLTLDPAGAADILTHQYITQIFSGLLQFDDNLQPAPDIAEKWVISADGLVYTFKLRKGVRFHDGKEVKAADFKYSWERALDPATASPTAPTYLGDIVGAREIIAGSTKALSGVKVVDDYTLQVTIDATKSYFLSKLTYPVSYAVDKANVESAREWWRNPNGTGPFKLNQWVESNSLILEKNDQYYGEPAKLDRVDFQLYSGLPMDLYETGKIDVTGVSLLYLEKVTDKSGPFYNELVISPELSFYYLGFNFAEPPFDDINIRRAFSYAVNKERLISLVYKNMVKKADGILPPGMPGFNPNLTGLGYDLNKAKEFIAASRYGDVSKLPPITFTVSGRGGGVSTELEAIIYEWRQNLGVDVKVRQLEPERFIPYIKQEKNEMFTMGWIADYPHPQDFLDVLFRTGADYNYGEFNSPEIDALLDKAGTEQNTAKSLALYQQAEQKMIDAVACIPLYFGESYILVKPYVKGYKPSPLGLVDLAKVSVEPY